MIVRSEGSCRTNACRSGSGDESGLLGREKKSAPEMRVGCSGERSRALRRLEWAAQDGEGKLLRDVNQTAWNRKHNTHLRGAEGMVMHDRQLTSWPGDQRSKRGGWCNRADLRYGIMAAHWGMPILVWWRAFLGEYSEVIHQNTGCMGLTLACKSTVAYHYITL